MGNCTHGTGTYHVNPRPPFKYFWCGAPALSVCTKCAPSCLKHRWREQRSSTSQAGCPSYQVSQVPSILILVKKYPLRYFFVFFYCTSFAGPILLNPDRDPGFLANLDTWSWVILGSDEQNKNNVSWKFENINSIFVRYRTVSKLAVFILRLTWRTSKLQRKPRALQREHPAFQNIKSVSRIRDVYRGSEFFPSRIHVKEFKYRRYFNPKKLFLSSRKFDPGCSYRIRIFYPSRIQGSKEATDPGSGSGTLFTSPI